MKKRECGTCGKTKDLSKFADCPDCVSGSLYCFECDGTGTAVCETCGQDATCSNCDGVGKFQCDNCEGTGKDFECQKCQDGWYCSGCGKTYADNEPSFSLNVSRFCKNCYKNELVRLLSEVG